MDIYQKNNSFEKRLAESERILHKHSDRIPIIVCKDSKCQLADIDKQKYLVPKDMSLGQFIYVIRKRIQLKSEEALFILINYSLHPSNKLIGEIYDECKDKDNFLYMVYSSENTFG